MHPAVMKIISGIRARHGIMTIIFLTRGGGNEKYFFRFCLNIDLVVT